MRATLLLAGAILAGLAAVVWTARDLDPLRVVERFAPARVRTVDLTGSEAFLRRTPSTGGSAEVPAPPGPAAKREVAPSGPPVREPRRAPAPAVPAAADAGPAEPESGPPAPVSPERVAAPVPPAGEGVEVVVLASDGSFDDALGEDAGVLPEARAEPARSAAGPPLDPAASARLVRRMLALYPRAGER